MIRLSCCASLHAQVPPGNMTGDVLIVFILALSRVPTKSMSVVGAVKEQPSPIPQVIAHACREWPVDQQGKH